jgi:pimeloyl-ACP methyl ester carboxylesterase
MNASETAPRDARSPDLTVKHRSIEVDGVRIFYREAGPPDALVVLLPHGYPSSSFQFRHFIAVLADH